MVVANLALGQFRLGFAGQPVAHTDALANFAATAVAGLAAKGPADGALWVLALLAAIALAFALWTRRRAAAVEVAAAEP